MKTLVLFITHTVSQHLFIIHAIFYEKNNLFIKEQRRKILNYVIREFEKIIMQDVHFVKLINLKLR